MFNKAFYFPHTFSNPLISSLLPEPQYYLFYFLTKRNNLNFFWGGAQLELKIEKENKVKESELHCNLMKSGVRRVTLLRGPSQLCVKRKHLAKNLLTRSGPQLFSIISFTWISRICSCLTSLVSLTVLELLIISLCCNFFVNTQIILCLYEETISLRLSLN